MVMNIEISEILLTTWFATVHRRDSGLFMKIHGNISVEVQATSYFIIRQ